PCLQTEQQFRAWLRTIVARILTGAAGRGGPDLTGRGRSLERARRAQPWPGRRTAGLVVRRAQDTEGCPGLAASRPGRRLLSPRVRGLSPRTYSQKGGEPDIIWSGPVNVRPASPCQGIWTLP